MERVNIARKVLKGMSSRDREILNRFYVLEESQECTVLNWGWVTTSCGFSLSPVPRPAFVSLENAVAERYN